MSKAWRLTKSSGVFDEQRCPTGLKKKSANGAWN